MSDDAVYFGREGQLRMLFNPTGGILATRDLEVSTFLSGDGGARVRKALNGNRTYVLNYGALGRVNFDWLNMFQQGHMGSGPFVLIDPGRKNLLTANQSSSTSQRNDTGDFTVSGIGGTISSDNSLTTPLPRTLKWSFTTNAPASALLTLDKPSTLWPGIPVVPGKSYVFSFMVVGGPIDLQAELTWYTLGGSYSTSTLSASVTTSATNWQRVYVSATVPAGCHWVGARVPLSGGTVLSGEVLNFSAFALSRGSYPREWTGGTGVYPVQVVSMPEKYGFGEPSMLVSPTLTLQEVR